MKVMLTTKRDYIAKTEAVEASVLYFVTTPR